MENSGIVSVPPVEGAASASIPSPVHGESQAAQGMSEASNVPPLESVPYVSAVSQGTPANSPSSTHEAVPMQAPPSRKQTVAHRIE